MNTEQQQWTTGIHFSRFVEGTIMAHISKQLHQNIYIYIYIYITVELQNLCSWKETAWALLPKPKGFCSTDDVYMDCIFCGLPSIFKWQKKLAHKSSLHGNSVTLRITLPVR